MPFGVAAPREVAIGQLYDKLDSDASVIQEVTIKKNTLTGKFTPNVAGTSGESNEFYVILPNSGDLVNTLTEKLHAKGINVRVEQDSFTDVLTSFALSALLPLIVMVLVWVIFFRPMQGNNNQAMSFGRAKPRRPAENSQRVTFEDVAGVEEAKQDLMEIVEFLKNSRKFQALGAKIPKGVLLLGPPGTGKTLLARAVAGEAGVPFFHISGSDFVEMFVGVGASRVRDLFETAKQNRPCLIFIDEIDAVGRQRGAGWGGGHDEREQTLNQLLVEMDGFDPNAGVIVIAATNRADVLDPALLRPGRFDRRVMVDAPDVKGREAILKVHTKGKPIAPEVNLTTLAKLTPGFSGAELANLINEAALLAARKDKRQIDMIDLEEAIDRELMGPARKSRVRSKDALTKVSVHEAGHAIVGELLAHADPVHKVTIVARGQAGGVTINLPDETREGRTKSEFEDIIAMALGGRIAELLVYGEINTGAYSDLSQVTRIAKAMVCEYGMSERLGNRRFGRAAGSPFMGRDFGGDESDYSEEMARIVDEEISTIIDRNYARAEQILTENRHLLDRLTAELLDRETLDRDEFLALIQDAVVPASGGRTPKPPTPPMPPTAPPPPVSDVASTDDAPAVPQQRLEPGLA
jgi:cell division protease FtsH